MEKGLTLSTSPRKSWLKTESIGGLECCGNMYGVPTRLKPGVEGSPLLLNLGGMCFDSFKAAFLVGLEVGGAIQNPSYGFEEVASDMVPQAGCRKNSGEPRSALGLDRNIIKGIYLPRRWPRGCCLWQVGNL